MVTMVLLNVALMWATPRLTFRRCLRFLLLATGTPRDSLLAVSPAQGAKPQAANKCLAAHFLDALLPGDGLARALAGAGVGLGPLAAHRQAAPVPHAAVTVDVLQAGNVLQHLPAKPAFDRVVAVEGAADAAQVSVGQAPATAL